MYVFVTCIPHITQLDLKRVMSTNEVRKYEHFQFKKQRIPYIQNSKFVK